MLTYPQFLHYTIRITYKPDPTIYTLKHKPQPIDPTHVSKDVLTILSSSGIPQNRDNRVPIHTWDIYLRDIKTIKTLKKELTE